MSKTSNSVFWGTIKDGVILLVLGTAISIALCTCSTEQAIQKALGVSADPPVFLGVKAISSREIKFDFSKPVTVSFINFDPPMEIQSITGGAPHDGKSVLVNLKESIQGGERIVADLLVEDELGNTLGVLTPFRSRNDRIPGLIITELCTEYTKPKAEFVEIKTLSAGNLGSVRLFIAGTGMAEPVFEFPPAEVAAGEYLVLHLRTLDPASVNETGSNLGLSPGTEALSDVRDFWVPGAVKRLRKTDAVLLLDQDDTALDGVLLSENPDNAWAKEDLNTAANLLAAQRIWRNAAGESRNLSPRDAVPTKGTTATRTICRDEAAHDNAAGTNAGWYICATSQASPGKPNSNKRYEPKP
jgi:hypothetical protein